MPVYCEWFANANKLIGEAVRVAPNEVVFFTPQAAMGK